MKEIWKWIPKFEGKYQASTFGNIKSFKIDKINGKIMQGNTLKDGRKRVNLDGQKYLVHRLILLTFNPEGQIDDKNLVMHLDGNPSNNNLTNLKWGNYKENANDDIKNLRTKIAKDKNKKIIEQEQNIILENEEWKDIIGYEGLYQVSNYGRIKSFYNASKPKIMSLCLGRTQDYYSICLTKNKQKKQHSVNRLVAEAFVPNPNNYPEVNHIDENTKNNKASNLEWVNHSQNVKHSAHKQSYPVGRYTLEGELIATYPSLAEAQRQTGIPRPSIASSIKRDGTCHGSKWRYL